MRLIDAEELERVAVIVDGRLVVHLTDIHKAPTVKPEITEEQAIDKLHETGWIIEHDKEMTDRPQKVVIIPHELIEKLVLCVVDTVENIDWDKAIEAYKERPTGKWIKHEWGYSCSICGVSNDYAYDNNIHKFTDNFCPNCGAMMDGGEE